MNGLVPNEKKEKIEFSLRLQGKELSNGLFDCLSSDWVPPDEARELVKELILLVAENVELDRRSEYSETPLHFSAKIGEEEAVRKLLERGANLEALDDSGKTALHLSAIRGNELSCKVLLQHGANPNAQNEWHLTPMMYAAWWDHAQVVKLLLQFGADTKITTELFEETALHFATPKCADAIKDHEDLTRRTQGKHVPKYSNCCLII